jgi:hypothetical protein
MKTKTLVRSSILAFSLVVGSALAIAQQWGPGMMGPGYGPGTMMRNWPSGPGGMMGMMGGCPMMSPTDAPTATFAEGRIAFLKAELAITDAQKSAWDAYAEAIKRNLQSMQGMWQTMKKVFEAETPVQRLDAHIAAMDTRLAVLKDIKPALETLYSALSADQKKKADQLLTGMGCMM